MENQGSEGSFFTPPLLTATFKKIYHQIVCSETRKSPRGMEREPLKEPQNPPRNAGCIGSYTYASALVRLLGAVPHNATEASGKPEKYLTGLADLFPAYSGK